MVVKPAIGFRFPVVGSCEHVLLYSEKDQKRIFLFSAKTKTKFSKSLLALDQVSLGQFSGSRVYMYTVNFIGRLTNSDWASDIK